MSLLFILESYSKNYGLETFLIFNVNVVMASLVLLAAFFNLALPSILCPLYRIAFLLRTVTSFLFLWFSSQASLYLVFVGKALCSLSCLTSISLCILIIYVRFPYFISVKCENSMHFFRWGLFSALYKWHCCFHVCTGSTSLVAALSLSLIP